MEETNKNIEKLLKEKEEGEIKKTEEVVPEKKTKKRKLMEIVPEPVNYNNYVLIAGLLLLVATKLYWRQNENYDDNFQ